VPFPLQNDTVGLGYGRGKGIELVYGKNVTTKYMTIVPPSTPLNVLYADDDKDDRFFFEKALNEMPISTILTSVQDGEQLMQTLLENSDNLPDILFLDLSMPRKTGFECLTEIKENPKLKELPVVVFTTSFGRGNDFEQGLINTLTGLGAQEYIRKPSDIEKLKQVIHRALNVVIANKLTNK
jgi:CheY-like chemotaxis protein